MVRVLTYSLKLDWISLLYMLRICEKLFDCELSSKMCMQVLSNQRFRYDDSGMFSMLPLTVFGVAGCY
jgi:hypothetical protein